MLRRATGQRSRKSSGWYAASRPPFHPISGRLPAPAYTYDKISIGMIDAHEFAGDAQALKVLDAALDSVLPHLPPRGLSRAEQYARPHKDESFCWTNLTLFRRIYSSHGSVERAVAIVTSQSASWRTTGTSTRWRRTNVLPGKHAYSHVNAMSSAMQAYLCWAARIPARGTEWL